MFRSIRRTGIRSFALSLLPLLVATPAFATTAVHLDTPALVRGSSDIVVGTVEATRCRWDETGTRILTEVDVRVTQSLKGASDRVTLVQLGGELDGMRYTVPGSPVFVAGEEALLFVWRDTQNRAQVNGLAQGKFDIARDPYTGTPLVQRRLRGLQFRDPRHLGVVPAEDAAPAVPLNRMLGEIRRILEEDGR